MAHEVLTPDTIFIPSFTLRAKDGASGVVRNLSWTLEEYATALYSLDVPNAAILWEETRSQFPAQAQLDTPGVSKGLTFPIQGMKEISRGEATLKDVLWSRRLVGNSLYALMQEDRFSASATEAQLRTYKVIEAGHHSMMIPVRVEMPEGEKGLVTASEIPHKILAVRIEEVLKTNPHPQTVDLARMVERFQQIQDENDVIGLELNVRDIFGNLPENHALQLIELMLQANQLNAPEVALVQMITYETMRSDLPNKLAQKSQDQAMELIGSEFGGAVMVSPGAGHLEKTLETVTRHQRT